MTARQLHETLHADPFIPFSIHLVDGREIYVRHPEFVLISDDGLIVKAFTGDDPPELIDIALIVSLRPLLDALKIPPDDRDAKLV